MISIKKDSTYTEKTFTQDPLKVDWKKAGTTTSIIKPIELDIDIATTSSEIVLTSEADANNVSDKKAIIIKSTNETVEHFVNSESVIISGTSEVVDIFGDNSCIDLVGFDNEIKSTTGKLTLTPQFLDFNPNGKFDQAYLNDDSKISFIEVESVEPIYGISIWTNRIEYISSNMYLLDARGYGGYYLYTNTSATSTYPIYIDGVLTNTLPPDGEWHHFYIDISSVGSILGFKLGNYYLNPSTSYAYNGSFDQLRLFNRSLSISEITALTSEADMSYKIDISSLSLVNPPNKLFLKPTITAEISIENGINECINYQNRSINILIGSTNISLVTDTKISENERIIVNGKLGTCGVVTFDTTTNTFTADLSQLLLVDNPISAYKIGGVLLQTVSSDTLIYIGTSTIDVSPSAIHNVIADDVLQDVSSVTVSNNNGVFEYTITFSSVLQSAPTEVIIPNNSTVLNQIGYTYDEINNNFIYTFDGLFKTGRNIKRKLTINGNSVDGGVSLLTPLETEMFI